MEATNEKWRTWLRTLEEMKRCFGDSEITQAIDTILNHYLQPGPVARIEINPDNPFLPSNRRIDSRPEWKRPIQYRRSRDELNQVNEMLIEWEKQQRISTRQSYDMPIGVTASSSLDRPHWTIKSARFIEKNEVMPLIFVDEPNERRILCQEGCPAPLVMEYLKITKSNVELVIRWTERRAQQRDINGSVEFELLFSWPSRYPAEFVFFFGFEQKFSQTKRGPSEISVGLPYQMEPPLPSVFLSIGDGLKREIPHWNPSVQLPLIEGILGGWFDFQTADVPLVMSSLTRNGILIANPNKYLISCSAQPYDRYDVQFVGMLGTWSFHLVTTDKRVATTSNSSSETSAIISDDLLSRES